MPRPPVERVGRRRVRLRRRLARHRRWIAAALAFIAVLLLGGAMTSDDPGSPVLVVTKDLSVGTRLADIDLRTVELPTALVPAGAITAAPDATGRVLSTPMRSGELLTETRLVGDALLVGQAPGMVAVPLRLADPTTVELLSPGDRIDVIAASSSQWASAVADAGVTAPVEDAAVGDPTARLVLEAVTVLTVGSPTSDGSLLGASDAERTGLVVVALRPADAIDLAAAAATAELSFALRFPRDVDG